VLALIELIYVSSINTFLLQTIIFLGTGALLIIISLGTGAFNAQTIILFSIIVRICTWILLILYSQVLQWACPSLARQRRALCFLVGREILVYRQVLRGCLVREMKFFGCHIGCFEDVGKSFRILIKKLIT